MFQSEFLPKTVGDWSEALNFWLAIKQGTGTTADGRRYSDFDVDERSFLELAIQTAEAVLSGDEKRMKESLGDLQAFKKWGDFKGWY